MDNWVEIKIHTPTSEETAIYGDEYSFIYDCEMPNNGAEVLITTKYRFVTTTIYDSAQGTFEGYEDMGEVVAWMYMPKPFQGAREE